MHRVGVLIENKEKYLDKVKVTNYANYPLLALQAALTNVALS